MIIDQVEIRYGLPDSCRHQAAMVYYDAFSQKLVPLVVTQEHGISLMEKAFDVDYAIVALHHGDCVGLAGLQYSGHRFVRPQLRAFARELGLVRGTLGWIALEITEPSPPKGELRIQCLAVASPVRGQGIGTSLLSATYELARAKGFSAVTLDVVDTNPGARRLYVRQGFVPVRTLRYPYLRRITGFSAVTFMAKKVVSNG